MKYLEIRRLGPIMATGVMEISPVTLFCGRQGRGKSTIVKILSTCIWLEKAISRQEVGEKYYTLYSRFRKTLCSYHQIEDFFRADTYIKYVGEAYTFEYKSKRLFIKKNRGDGGYLLPKVMYIPAERNFMVAIEQADKVRGLPTSLVTLQVEYQKALGKLKGSFDLVDGFVVEYSRQNKITYIAKGGSKVRAYKGASGLQSLLPLLLVSRSLSNEIAERVDVPLSAEELSKLRKKIAEIQEDAFVSDQLKKLMIENVTKVIAPKSLWCIVEEPEQNLYPLTQKELLFNLLESRKRNNGSGLVMTTHSPYIINYLSICVKAYQVANKVGDEGNKLVEAIVPHHSQLAPNELSIYEIEENGVVRKLESYEGIPEDSNFLNNALQETNQLFSDLMDIEDGIAER